MDELRLILLAVGAIVIIGVYLHSRRERAGERRIGSREEPRLGGDERDDNSDDEEMPNDLPSLRATGMDDHDLSEQEHHHAVPAADGDEDQEAVKLPVHDEKIIVLNIFPQQEGDRFPGSDLLDVFDRAGMEYGLYNVFHRLKETREGPVSVFSIASATEPGAFDVTVMAEQEFRGLTLFMVLPGPVRGVDAFADMMATARRIAEQIRGEVKDRNRSTLTRQTAHHLREEIIAFEHRLQHKS